MVIDLSKDISLMNEFGLGIDDCQQGQRDEIRCLYSHLAPIRVYYVALGERVRGKRCA
jgi:hypothetical protein